jgi:uncharacterized protein YraI
MQRLIRIVLFNLLLCLPLSAFALDGYVSANVNLRSGPGLDYPVVSVLPQWTGLQVMGCVNGYAWCDVQVGPDRGWIYAEYLQSMSNNEPVYVNDYAVQLGVPIVTFSIGTYWDSYYRTRPWYSQRSYWIGRPSPVYRPLPPRRPNMRPMLRPSNVRPISPPRPPSQVRPSGRPPVRNNLPPPPHQTVVNPSRPAGNMSPPRSPNNNGSGNHQTPPPNNNRSGPGNQQPSKEQGRSGSREKDNNGH